jgi:hypothetical protein
MHGLSITSDQSLQFLYRYVGGAESWRGCSLTSPWKSHLPGVQRIWKQCLWPCEADLKGLQPMRGCPGGLICATEFGPERIIKGLKAETVHLSVSSSQNCTCKRTRNHTFINQKCNVSESGIVPFQSQIQSYTKGGTIYRSIRKVFVMRRLKTEQKAP